MADDFLTNPVTLVLGPEAVTVSKANPLPVQDDAARFVLGSPADAKSAATDATPATAMAVLKQISASVQSTLDVAGDTPDGQGNVTGNNPIKVAGVFNTTLPTWTTGQIVTAQFTSRGGLLTTLVSSSGVLSVSLTDNSDAVASVSANSKIAVINRNTVFNGTNWDRMAGGTAGLFVAPSASAPGSTTSKIKSAATTNSTNLKASAGNVQSMTLSNTNAAARYVKLYNKATAPTVGTDTPAYTLAIAGGATLVVDHTFMERFTAGIGYGISTGFAESDTGATAVDDVVGQITWI